MFICITFITLIPFFKLAKQKQFSPDASKIQDKNEKKREILKKTEKKMSFIPADEPTVEI